MNPQPQNAGTSATLRPRNRRLISVDDAFDALNNDSSSRLTPPQSATSSSIPSRAVSPIPSQHPSRSTSSIRRPPQRLQQASGILGSSNFGSSQQAPSLAAGLWESSWSSLQGLASNLLGSDTGPSKIKARSSASPRRRRSREGLQGLFSSIAGREQWGPSGNPITHLAQGSKEDRLAQVQVKKREALLAANGSTSSDFIGRYKRRTSEEEERGSDLLEGHDPDALVYLHHVQPSDTLAGITIRYNCPTPVVRKANRLWPNDSIQIRRVVYLPVDACGVKGRKIADPTASFGIFGDGSNEAQSSTILPEPKKITQNNPSQPGHPRITAFSSVPTSPSLSTTNPDATSWTHDSWVLIDPSPTPIEIVRLSRRALGFFPPRRRESVTCSDLESPYHSLDLSRPSITLSPQRRSSPNRYISPRRVDGSHSSSGSYLASALSGPGGVGTFDSDVHIPGPAPDKLNQLFAPHLPNVAPRTSFESVHSNSSTGIENVSGAIEGWVRKLATKAAAVVQPPEGGGSSGGELIELVEGSELGGEDESDRRTIKGKSSAGDRNEEERLLRERFPIRGRVFEDEGAKRRAGSSR